MVAECYLFGWSTKLEEVDRFEFDAVVAFVAALGPRDLLQRQVSPSTTPKEPPLKKRSPPPKGKAQAPTGNTQQPSIKNF